MAAEAEAAREARAKVKIAKLEYPQNGTSNYCCAVPDKIITKLRFFFITLDTFHETKKL